MSLRAETKLGHFKIISAIGAGGMGEVYKARDTRLDRVVAIKVLPDHLADRRELRERFEREARTIASLNHPHICTLFDIGRHDGLDFLVMEYLEGETVAQKLLNGPLPLDQVLQYSIEIADALDKAHRKGITHRDLKPGNIMLTKSGTKLLDFGLAKLKQAAANPMDEEPLDSQATTAPPRPKALSVEGDIIGTPQYMAPEQVEGRQDDIDARTDIFSFGAVLYEMATGKKAFEGSSKASVMASILKDNPPAMSSLLPSGTVTPPALDRLVKRCLAKDREDRWQSARDLWQDLRWIAEGGEQASTTAALQTKSASKGWPRAAALGLAALVLMTIAAVMVWLLKPSAQQPVTRLTVTLPPGQRLAALDQPAIAISPDGKNIVYVAVQDQSPNRKGGVASNPSPERERGGPPGSTKQSPLADARGSDSNTIQQLYLRPLDSNESKPIAGTEGAVGPFFSSDGQWIGFFAGGRLKKVPVNGGAAVTLANTPTPGGASWSSQGILALQGNLTASWELQQVSSDGGTPQPLTRLAKGETFQRWPEYLPGGKGVLYASSPGASIWTTAQIAAQTAGGSEPKKLAQGAQPRYAMSGHLLYAQSGTLMAAPFDARRIALIGAAVPALEGVMQATITGAAQYSVSSTGTLVYIAGGLSGSRNSPVWVSRNGEEQLLPAVPHIYQFPRISPDGRRVTAGIAEKDGQIWIYDIFRDTLTRLTFEGSTNNVPAWSPDGKRIAFNSNREGATNLFWQLADGSGGTERLTTSDYLNSASSFSPDGQLLAFTSTTPETGRDIWVLNLKDRKAQPFLKTPNEETAAKFSPDGKWMAYSSDESGRREIYVQPYPGPGGKWQISSDGGQEPVWNPKGGELFYRSGSKIMAVDVNQNVNPSRDREGAGVSGAGSSGFSAGKPRMLFDGPYLPTGSSIAYYDVSPDGQRFLMLKPVESQATAPTQINVVLNWFEELKKKVPVK